MKDLMVVQKVKTRERHAPFQQKSRYNYSILKPMAACLLSI